MRATSDFQRGAREFADEAAAKAKMRPNGGAQTASRLVAIDLADFLERTIPSRDYVLKPVLPTQGLAMVVAMAGMLFVAISRYQIGILLIIAPAVAVAVPVDAVEVQ